MNWYNHPQYIEDKLTHLSEAEAAYGLREAWKELFGSYPPDKTLALLWSQTALETERFKSLRCYNWGNIKKKHSPDDGHYFTMYYCSEIINNKEQHFHPPHEQTHFRAYVDVVSGAKDYLSLLSTKKRYQQTWQALKLGDPVLFVAELKKGGYFTAGLERYTKAVVSLTNEFLRRKNKLLKWDPPDVPISIDDEEPIPDTDPSPPPSHSSDPPQTNPVNPDPEPEIKTEPANDIPEPPPVYNRKKDGIILAFLIGAGALFTWISTWFGCG